MAKRPPLIFLTTGDVAFRAVAPTESLNMGDVSADQPPLTETEAWAASEPAAGTASSDADARAISDELLGAFMALMPDAAVAVDSAGRVVSVNEQAEELFGYPPGFLTGLPIETLVPERARNRHRHHRTAYVAAPENRPMGAGLELAGRRRDGREFPVDISLAAITSSAERLVVAAVRDLSDKQAATAAQAELAAIVRSSLDAIMSTTLEGQITSWNPAAERLFGYGSDEIVGQHIAALVPTESSVVLEELLELAADGAHRGARDTRWRRRDGEEVDVAVSISPLRDKSGTLLGFSSVVRDISERKQAENDLRRLLAEEQRLERQHAATAEIRLALLSGTPLVESVTIICARTAEQLSAPVAVISVRDGDDLRVMAATGAAAELVGELVPAQSSFAARVLESGEQSQAPRRSATSGMAVPPATPDGPILGIPIVVGGTGAAVLTVVREIGAAAYGPSDLVLADALAAQAALAFELERARQDREQMMLVGDRERIARDLHDHVIQQLFATGMALQSTLPLIDRAAAGTRVTDAIDSLDETIREIRNTIYNLSVPMSGNRRLRARILELVETAAESLGYAPSVRFDGPIDVGVPDTLAPQVLAVVREALSNAARHARAESVSVQVGVAAGSLTVTVVDDGIGAGDPVRSSGLANLDQRARLLGGHFDISLPDEGGTRIDWVVPLQL
jgi:PAS domain S-box-containing protein